MSTFDWIAIAGTRKKAGAPGLLGMSNDDMKALLSHHGLPVSGTREVLVKRILMTPTIQISTQMVPIPTPITPIFLTIATVATPTIPTLATIHPVIQDHETKVVNVKVKYLRPRYNDLKEWCEDPNNVYIGRGGIVFVEIDGRKVRYPPQSKWHNPYKLKDHGDQTLPLFEQYIRSVPFLDEIEELRGKNLGCWCVEPGKPEIQCHGHILVRILNERIRR
jgi:hypothetical protein